MKNTDFQIFEILDPQICFENSAEAKLSKLEPFAWFHWEALVGGGKEKKQKDKTKVIIPYGAASPIVTSNAKEV